MDHHDGRPLLAMTLGAACIAGSAVLMKLAGSSPSVTALLRCALALPVLGMATVFERRRGAAGMTRRSRWLARAAGVFLAADLILWSHAINEIGAGLGTVTGNMQVLITALLAWWLLGERPGLPLLLGSPLMLGGLALVGGLAGARSYGADPGLGVVFGIGVGTLYSVYILLLRQATSGAGGGRVSVAEPLFEATAGAALGSLLLGFALRDFRLGPAWPALGWLAALALTSQVIGWLLITTSMPRLPAWLVGALLLIQPAGSVALSMAFLGEHPSAWQLGGVAAMLSGVAIVATAHSRSAPLPAHDPPRATCTNAKRKCLQDAQKPGVTLLTLLLQRKPSDSPGRPIALRFARGLALLRDRRVRHHVNPRSGQALDAKAIVIDPQVPAGIRRELERAPMRWRTPFGAPPPDVVPARRGRKRVFTPQGRQFVTRIVTMAIFLAATITGFVLSAKYRLPVAGFAGFCSAIVSINRFIAAGSAFDAARTVGWRQPRPTADPSHPAWDGLHAVTAYHRRYVSPRRDMDAGARPVWARAVDAAAELRESEVVRLGLVDSVQVATVLPYHLWDIAERLARLSALRMQHTAILRGVDPDDPDVATLLAPQRRAQEAADADIEQRVRQLEVFAGLVGQADAARRRERAVRKLATLNDSHVELLAHIGQNTGHDALTEQMTVDVQAIIAQADEAVRQANEVGRSLVLPRLQEQE